MMPEPQARVFAQGKTDVEGALLVMRFSLSRPVIRTAIDPQTVEAGPNLLCRQSTVLLPPDRSALRVDCEAPRGNPPRVRLRLFDEASGHQTLAVTGDATRGGAPIRIEWLSPLSRRTGFLHLLPGARIQSGAAYNFPQERLPSARLSYQTPLGATYRELRFALRQTPLGAYRR
jgi:hypothetical protein